MYTENLALYQPTWQTGTEWPNTGADRAVDGRYINLTWYGGQCAASQGGSTAEWLVDLGGVKSIHHVFIQHAKGKSMCQNNRMLSEINKCYTDYNNFRH